MSTPEPKKPPPLSHRAFYLLTLVADLTNPKLKLATRTASLDHLEKHAVGTRADFLEMSRLARRTLPRGADHREWGKFLNWIEEDGTTERLPKEPIMPPANPRVVAEFLAAVERLKARTM